MIHVLDSLRGIVGPAGLLTGADVSQRSTSWADSAPCRAGAIVRPRTTSQLSAVLAACHAARQPVIARGGATGLVAGLAAGPDDLIVSTELMTTIEEIDTAQRVITVQAGVPLEAAQKASEAKGLLLALDLGARGTATAGGVVATNAGGNRVIRYGMTRESVLGLEAVLADGTVISSLNRMLKNNAGYDLKQLFIGSEGTLGVVSRVTFRLREIAPASATALVAAQALDAVIALLRHMDKGLGGELTAFEVLWDSFYSTVTANNRHARPLPVGSPLYVLLEGAGTSERELDNTMTRVLGEAVEAGLATDAVIAKSAAEVAALWAIRDDVDALRGDAPQTMFDVSVPLPHMTQYLAEVEARLQALDPDFRWWIWGHLGDGNLHIWVPQAGRLAGKHEAIEHAVYEPLKFRGGSVSGEHGIGTEKLAYLGFSRGPEELALMRTLKHALDPHGILSPGKVLG